MQTQAEAIVAKAEFNCQVGYTAELANGTTQTLTMKSHAADCQTDAEDKPTLHSLHTQTKSHKVIGLGIQTDLIPGPETISRETGTDLVLVDDFAQTHHPKCIEGGVQTTPVLVMWPHEYPSPPITIDAFTSMPVVESTESFMQTKLHAHDVLVRHKTSDGFVQTEAHHTKEKPSQTEQGKVKGKVVQTDEYIPPTPPREEVSLQTDAWKGLDVFSQTALPKLKHFAINTEGRPITAQFIQTDSHPLDDASSQTTLVEHKEFATQSFASTPSFSESGDQTDDELLMSVPFVIAALSKRDTQHRLSEEVTETMTTQTVHVKKRGGKKNIRSVSPVDYNTVSFGTQYEPTELHGSSTQTDAVDSTPDAFERIARLQSQILVIQREKDTLSQQVAQHKALDVFKTPAACQTDLSSDEIRDKETAVAASLMETSAKVQTLEHEMSNLRSLNKTLVLEIHSVKNRPKAETVESGLQTDAYESQDAKQVSILEKQLKVIRDEKSTLLEKITAIRAKSAAAKSVSDHEAQTDPAPLIETVAISLQTDEDTELSYKLYVLEQELSILRIENTTLVGQLNTMTENYGILEKQLERKVAESLVKKDVASFGLQTEIDIKEFVEVSLQTDADERLTSMEQDLLAVQTQYTQLSQTFEAEERNTTTVTAVESITPNVSQGIVDPDEITLLQQELRTFQEQHAQLQAEYENEKNRTVVETTTTTTTESIDERILNHIQSLEQEIVTLKEQNEKLREEIDLQLKMATSNNDTQDVAVASNKVHGVESRRFKITEQTTETRTTVEKNGAVGYNYNAELAARNELLVSELIELRRKHSLLDTHLKSLTVSTHSTQMMRSDSSVLRESDISVLRSELIRTRSKYVATLEELNKVRRQNINMIEQPVLSSPRELPPVPKELYMRLEELERINGELQSRLKSLPPSSIEETRSDPHVDALATETQELKEELERQSGLTELYRQKLVDTSKERDALKGHVTSDWLGSSSGVPTDVRRHRSIPSLNRNGELQYNIDTRLSQQAEEISLMELELAKQQQKVQHLESLLGQSRGSSSKSRSVRNIQPVSPFDHEQQQQSLAPFAMEKNLVFTSHLQPQVKPDAKSKGWTYIDKRISVRLLKRMKKPATKDT
jgi:hypothetical protein